MNDCFQNECNEVIDVFLQRLNSNYALDEWGNLSKEQQNAIKKAVDQLDNGQGRKHNDVISDFRNRYLND